MNFLEKWNENAWKTNYMWKKKAKQNKIESTNAIRLKKNRECAWQDKVIEMCWMCEQKYNFPFFVQTRPKVRIGTNNINKATTQHCVLSEREPRYTWYNKVKIRIYDVFLFDFCESYKNNGEITKRSYSAHANCIQQWKIKNKNYLCLPF